MPASQDLPPRVRELRIQLLGGFSVLASGRQIDDAEWRLRKARNLIKLLALAPNHRLHREQVMDLFWPELTSESAANNLRQIVYHARRVLDSGTRRPHYLQLQGDLLLLCPSEALSTDVEAFEAAASRAREAREPDSYLEAIGRYTGDLLPDDPYEDWAIGRRDALRGSYLALLGKLAQLQEEREEAAAAVQTLRRIVAIDPTREEAHVRLMRLYAAAGQRKLALGQYAQLKQTLRRELDADPDSQTDRLRQEIADGRFSVHPGKPDLDDARLPLTPVRRHNLTAPLTTFVGREREVKEATFLLASSRLVTVHGPGGCGKTRLAVEIARRLVDSYRDGVWLIDLASLVDSGLVAPTAASVLGTVEIPGRSPSESLVAGLRSKELLLVLDGCEQVVGAAAEMCGLLLSACEGIRVLATSRQTLSVPGEAVYRLSPLPAPDGGKALDPEEAATYDSVRLFVDRARLVRHDFQLNSHNSAAVARICRRLDGMPLAIELAAARTKVLSAAGIDQRLGDRFRLLIGEGRSVAPRHRALREVVDWSYDLLAEPERSLFEQLSVFAGGWTLEAAEAVCGDTGEETPDVLDLLSRLVDKSMVIAEAALDGGTRGRLLDTLREYAAERLAKRGGAERVRERHARRFVALAELAEQHLTGEKQREWLGRLEQEQDNLRAALAWSIESEQAGTGLRLAVAVHQFWFMRGGAFEGRGWLERLLALQCRETLSLPEKSLRAGALLAASELAQLPGKWMDARAFSEESLALCEEIGDRPGVARSLRHLGSIALWSGEIANARSLLERSLRMHRELGDRWGEALALFLLAQLTWFSGDATGALSLSEESAAIWRDLADKRMYAYACGVVCSAAIDLGEYGRAQRAITENLTNVLAIGDMWAVPLTLEAFSVLAAVSSQPERCLRLAGAASALRESVGGMASPPPVLARLQVWLARARQEMGDEPAAAAWAGGRMMTLPQAVDYAQAEAAAGSSPVVPVSRIDELSWAPLSRREASVAVLIGRGFTNRQIARELAIGEGTAANHVEHILRKLKLKSRAQIAAWAVERQLSSQMR